MASSKIDFHILGNSCVFYNLSLSDMMAVTELKNLIYTVNPISFHPRRYELIISNPCASWLMEEIGSVAHAIVVSRAK